MRGGSRPSPPRSRTGGQLLPGKPLPAGGHSHDPTTEVSEADMIHGTPHASLGSSNTEVASHRRLQGVRPRERWKFSRGQVSGRAKQVPLGIGSLGEDLDKKPSLLCLSLSLPLSVEQAEKTVLRGGGRWGYR